MRSVWLLKFSLTAESFDSVEANKKLGSCHHESLKSVNLHTKKIKQNNILGFYKTWPVIHKSVHLAPEKKRRKKTSSV